jgi:teichoic acid transport system ATP-binding protein
MSADNIAIRVENLTKVYKLYDKPTDRLKESLHPFRKTYHREFYALKDISFEIKKGEVVGIIGKNGSGKSTLLKIITGVLTPTSGTVQVNGKISALLELGAGFNPEMTGIENIYLNGTIMGYTKEEMDTKIDDILAFADIGDFVYQPVKSYSSGMFARLAFAVSINVSPDILIVDEALAVGDMMFQLKCYRKFKEFREQGKTILFVSHSMDTIIRYCTQAIVINDGVKIEEGSPKEMVDVYKKLLVNTKEEVKFEGELVNKLSKRDSYWKDEFEVHKGVIKYGSGSAEIIDYGIFDQYGNPSTELQSDELVTVKMHVRFYEDVCDPIFALTIKDLKGYELAGTNTMVEYINTGLCKKGEERIITFTQKLNLTSGSYTISLGCTGFRGEEFIVYHRLYDVLVFRAILTRGVVGVFDMNSEIHVQKVSGG